MQVPKSVQNFSKIGDGLCQLNTETVFQFGQFKLNEKQRLLLCGNQQVEIKAKDFDLLLVLLKNQPRLVTKQELMAAVWPESFVEEANLGVHVAQLRKILRQHSTTEDYIQTVHRHGYRFIGQVTLLNQSDSRRSLSEAEAVAEAILTLGGGLRIEAWRSSSGTKIRLAVPTGMSSVRASETQSFETEGLQLSTVDRGDVLDVTVSLDFKLP